MLRLSLQMRIRYVKLATFYFFYFASLGTYLPYWPLYLKDLGYAPHEIGALMAIALGTKVVAPYIWGWAGDRTRRRLRIVRITTLLACLSFSLALFGTGYYWIVLTLFMFSFFWNAALPQLEVLTMDSLRHHSHHYSRIRLWGSIGFIIASVIVAPLIMAYGTTLVPWVITLILVALWLTSLTLSESRTPQPSDAECGLWRTLNLRIVSLLMVCFLVQLAHGPYYAFFTIFMEEQGYSRNLIGQFWAIGVVAEVVVLIFVGRLLQGVGAVYLLLTAILATSLRWLLIGNFADYLWVVLFAQLLHAVTFGVYHASMIYLISRLFPAALKGRGQALYSSLSFGVGGGLGTYAAGFLWDALSGRELFMISSGVVLSALFFLLPLRRVVAAQPLRAP